MGELMQSRRIVLTEGRERLLGRQMDRIVVHRIAWILLDGRHIMNDLRSACCKDALGDLILLLVRIEPPFGHIRLEWMLNVFILAVFVKDGIPVLILQILPPHAVRGVKDVAEPLCPVLLILRQWIPILILRLLPRHLDQLGFRALADAVLPLHLRIDRLSLFTFLCDTLPKDAVLRIEHPHREKSWISALLLCHDERKKNAVEPCIAFSALPVDRTDERCPDAAIPALLPWEFTRLHQRDDLLGGLCVDIRFRRTLPGGFFLCHDALSFLSCIGGACRLLADGCAGNCCTRGNRHVRALLHLPHNLNEPCLLLRLLGRIRERLLDLLLRLLDVLGDAAAFLLRRFQLLDDPVMKGIETAHRDLRLFGKADAVCPCTRERKIGLHRHGINQNTQIHPAI